MRNKGSEILERGRKRKISYWESEYVLERESEENKQRKIKIEKAIKYLITCPDFSEEELWEGERQEDRWRKEMGR